MELQPNEIMVLGAIKNGAKKFDKIRKMTKLESEELNKILEKLEEKNLIEVKEKSGLFGKKIEITLTDSGNNEYGFQTKVLNENWQQMVSLYKEGDKEKLKQHLQDNKSILPTMMFFGIMDLVMFATMMSLMGAVMTDFVPAEQIPEGMDGADADGGMDDGGFDIDIGF